MKAGLQRLGWVVSLIPMVKVDSGMEGTSTVQSVHILSTEWWLFSSSCIGWTLDLATHSGGIDGRNDRRN